jgi:8-oxo-dGTP pyrophosphatase MutT (NUDIX family)
MTTRQPLTYRSGDDRFNYRVAAVIMRDSHVLVCREEDDPYVLLPGGRVEMHEPSPVALRRELNEELRCDGQVEAHLFTAEDFFHRQGERFHEIGVYYSVTLTGTFPFAAGETVFETVDEGKVLRFTWLRNDPAVLAAANLLPVWLPRRLIDLPERPEYLISSEIQDEARERAG